MSELKPKVVITTAGRAPKRRFAPKPATLKLRQLMKRLQKKEQQLKTLRKEKDYYARRCISLEIELYGAPQSSLEEFIRYTKMVLGGLPRGKRAR